MQNWLRKRKMTKCLICKNTRTKILKLSTLKRYARLNMQHMREGNGEALNATKDNGTTETIEEPDNLC